MQGALQLINALISLFALADRLGLNVDNVKAAFDKAKAEGRDVTPEEVQTMAAAAEQAGARVDHLVDQLPPGDDGSPS